MGDVRITNELLDFLGEKFQEDKDANFIRGVSMVQTFDEYVNEFIEKVRPS